MKLKYLIIGVIALCTFSNLNAQETYLTVSQTPKQIKTYINKYFPGSKIVSIKKDKEILNTEYDVHLDSMVKLEFDKDYLVKKIESKRSLPNVVIPTKISSYVSKNYPNNIILEWEKKSKGQKIELDNGLDLVFDLKGNFMGIDD